MKHQYGHVNGSRQHTTHVLLSCCAVTRYRYLVIFHQCVRMFFTLNRSFYPLTSSTPSRCRAECWFFTTVLHPVFVKFKCVRCEFDRLSGWYSTLRSLKTWRCKRQKRSYAAQLCGGRLFVTRRLRKIFCNPYPGSWNSSRQKRDTRNAQTHYLT